MVVVKYLDVISGAIKARTYGYVTAIQYVGWDDVPEFCLPTPFDKIGTVCVQTPPSLPIGFKMKPHPSWIDLRDRILEGWKSATFQELDQKMLDMETLADITKFDWAGDEFIPYQERMDWVDWAYNFDDAWSDLPEALSRLFEAAVPHTPPHECREVLLKNNTEKGLDCQPIGNRVMPPSLVDVLKLMLAKAEEQENE
jgi:hypothetical protein